MTDIEDLDERLRAVERALTDGDHDVSGLEDAAELRSRIEAVETELASLTDRVDELDASVQAVRGYVGNVRQVNEKVEQRADAAIATVERLETRVEDLERDQAAASHNTEIEPGNHPQSPAGGTTTVQQSTEQDPPGQRARRVMASATTDGGRSQNEEPRCDQQNAPGETADRSYRRHRDRTADDTNGMLAGLRDILR